MFRRRSFLRGRSSRRSRSYSPPSRRVRRRRVASYSPDVVHEVVYSSVVPTPTVVYHTVHPVELTMYGREGGLCGEFENDYFGCASHSYGCSYRSNGVCAARPLMADVVAGTTHVISTASEPLTVLYSGGYYGAHSVIHTVLGTDAAASSSSTKRKWGGEISFGTLDSGGIVSDPKTVKVPLQMISLSELPGLFTSVFHQSIEECGFPKQVGGDMIYTPYQSMTTDEKFAATYWLIPMGNTKRQQLSEEGKSTVTSKTRIAVADPSAAGASIFSAAANPLPALFAAPSDAEGLGEPAAREAFGATSVALPK